jgi:hypothetical protein
VTREKFLHLEKNERYFIFRSWGMNPFGGLRRRGFGIEYEYGAVSATRKHFKIVLNFWRWELSITYCWKLKTT